MTAAEEKEIPQDAPRDKKPSWRQRVRRLLIYMPVLFLAVFVGCGVVSTQFVKRYEQRIPRNPETGIMLGAEERYLGPEDAFGAVLFVHGFVGTGDNFADLPERLAELGWRVRIMRLPGHGTSPFDYEKQTPEALLAAVTRELQALQSEYPTVALVGHSMGGALSTLAVSEHGADKLVLAAPYFGVTYHWYYGLKLETWTKITKPLMRWVYKGRLFIQVNRKEAKDSIGTYDWVPMQGLITLHEVGDLASDPAVLDKIACPVLLIHAEGDVASSIECAREAVERMASTDKRIVTLTKSNHHVFWDYERELVMDEICKFLGAPESPET
ncbi:alpha/beta hydrolase [Candidatus Hydrogenedentota bacterium]